jgi:hypothetical protein
MGCWRCSYRIQQFPSRPLQRQMRRMIRHSHPLRLSLLFPKFPLFLRRRPRQMLPMSRQIRSRRQIRPRHPMSAA